MKKMVWTTLPFLYMIAIWLMSSHPADAVVSDRILSGVVKDSLHIVEFALLYALFVMALRAHGHFTGRTNFVVAIVASLYGIVDEFHQSFVPSRSSSIIDVVKDVTGVFILYYFVDRQFFKRTSD
ncbi:VanZ family protein [Bacillus coahuilensis p1.1.43]|uniref:VanZ family protein n=1 Tax=Bacillus coahuilensis p1.1.43 TaxID=1150625 RepID=A0A147K495_9BACI|nr:VanZ family protein [Bacillus coahuilensis]KUP04140.1 VanZ family protein [Bacillus coahuilensis p1.1.43]